MKRNNKNDKFKYLIPECEINKKIKKIKINFDNITCEHCGKHLDEEELVFNNEILCPDCYNYKKEDKENLSDFVDYLLNNFNIRLISSDFLKLKIVLLNKGYTYKQIFYTVKYLNEIINKDFSQKSIGLIYFYIDKAVKYANENDIDLSIIPKEDYFEEYKNKHKIESIKANIKMYLRRKEKDFIIGEYTQANSILEEQLEDYMINHLYLIEDGMKYYDRQKPIKNGIIDIAAKDKNNISCIIELKNNDKCDRLERQCKEYPEIFIKKDVPFRMITLTPGYKEDRFTIINNIGYVEMYKYDITYGTLNNPIKELHIKRIN